MGWRGMWRAAAGIGMLVWLAGCGGGGGGADEGGPPPGSDPPTPTVANYFPLEPGARWVLVTDTTSEPTLRWVNGTSSVVSGIATIVDEQVLPGPVSTERTAYVAAADGVREYTLDTSDPILQALSGLLLMKWPATTGETTPLLDRTLDSGTDFDGDGQFDRVRLVGELLTVGFERIVVPAGSFAGSLHQRLTIRLTVFPSSGLPNASLITTLDNWYADGVGPVRSELRSDVGGSITLEVETLMAYRVGSRASDTTPPAVLSVIPATPTARASALQVSATLDEAVDPHSALAALMVRDATGQTVAGTVDASGGTVTFTANQPWAAGRYDVELGTGVTDLVGNPLAAVRRWSFEADATSPGVTRSSPATGATEVPLDSTVRLWFGEPVAPASVSTTTVSLSALYGDTVPITVAVDGDQVTLQPGQPLARGETYVVTLHGVTDLAGNPVSAGTEVLRFSVTQEGFELPVDVAPGSWVWVNAAADFDGDGLVDVVVYDQSLSGLRLVRQLAGGSFAAPVPLDAGSLEGCRIEQMVTGDFDADGRTDLAIAGCGVQVLHQTADGRLVPGPQFPAATSSLQRVDLDGDGRDDLIGTALDRSMAFPFTQAGGGGLVQQPTIDLGATGGEDFGTGDIDGDGRVDLVLLRAALGQQVALLLQQPDGSFAAPTYLSLPSGVYVNVIDVGDLDGDGRADIVMGHGGNAPTQVWLLRQGAGGSFDAAVALPTHDSPEIVRIVDITGDGRLDLLVVHPGFSRIGLYRQRADGSLGSEELFRTDYGSDRPDSLAVADLDGDGRLDLLHEGLWLRQVAPADAGPTLAGAMRRARLLLKAAVAR